MSNQNINPIANSVTGVLKLNGLDRADAWSLAIDVVDYPVHILPLSYVNPETGDYQLSIGDTNTGRETEFFGVIVDRLRDGVLSQIAAVTGIYGTLKTADIYRDLQVDLQDIPHRLQDIYVSGSGGLQSLRIQVEDVVSIHGRDVRMMVTLLTSVDGTSRHVLQLSVWDIKNKVELLGVSGRAFEVSSRHTTTINERHIAFSTILVTLINEWKTTIIPMMEIMGETEFDTPFALDLLQNIMESSEFPDRHIKAAAGAYSQSGKANTLDVIQYISEYCESSFDDKQERLSFFRKKLNKNVKKVFDKMLAQPA